MASYTVDIWERIMPDKVNYWVIRVTGREGEIWLVVPQSEKYSKEHANDAYLFVTERAAILTPDFTTKVSWPLEDFTLENIAAKLKEYKTPETTKFVKAEEGVERKYYLFGTTPILTKDGNPIEEIATTQEEKLTPKITPIKRWSPH